MTFNLRKIFISVCCFLFCLICLSSAYPQTGLESKNNLSAYQDIQNPELVKTVKELEHSVIQQHNVSLAQKPQAKPKAKPQAKPKAKPKVIVAPKKTAPPVIPLKEDALQKLSKKNNEINIALKEKERQAQDCIAKLNNLEKNNANMQAKMQNDLGAKLGQVRNENAAISSSLKSKTQEADSLKKQLDDIKLKLSNIEKEKAGLETKLGQELKDSKEKSDKLLKEKTELEAKLLDLKNALYSLRKEKAILEMMLANQPEELRVPLAAKPQSDKLMNNKNIHINLGYSYGMSGELDQAIGQYRAALKYSPDDKDLHYNLAYLLAKKNRNREAIEQYKSALKGTPEDREIYYNLSIIYSVKLKDQKLGQEYYKKFLDLSSKNSELPLRKSMEISPKG